MRPSRKLTAEPAAEPDSVLDAIRARIGRSASYVHSFDIGTLPFRIARGIICSTHTDKKTETAYIRLTNGKADAASNGATDAYSIRLPDKIEASASGRLISVNVVARAARCPKSRFAIAYSTNDAGNSGWHWREAGRELGCTSANVAYHMRQIRRQYEAWSGAGTRT